MLKHANLKPSAWRAMDTWWTPEMRAELEQIYRQLDREIEALGVRCWERGICCDFERSPHVLYASSVEIAYVKELHPENFSAGSRLCPFWLDGQCMNRQRRPLGCRTYFCDGDYRQELEAVYERTYRRIKRLASAVDCPWSYEPFVAALRQPSPVCA